MLVARRAIAGSPRIPPEAYVCLNCRIQAHQRRHQSQPIQQAIIQPREQRQQLGGAPPTGQQRKPRNRRSAAQFLPGESRLRSMAAETAAPHLPDEERRPTPRANIHDAVKITRYPSGVRHKVRPVVALHKYGSQHAADNQRPLIQRSPASTLADFGVPVRKYLKKTGIGWKRFHAALPFSKRNEELYEQGYNEVYGKLSERLADMRAAQERKECDERLKQEKRDRYEQEELEERHALEDMLARHSRAAGEERPRHATSTYSQSTTAASVEYARKAGEESSTDRSVRDAASAYLADTENPGRIEACQSGQRRAADVHETTHTDTADEDPMELVAALLTEINSQDSTQTKGAQPWPSAVKVPPLPAAFASRPPMSGYSAAESRLILPPYLMHSHASRLFHTSTRGPDPAAAPAIEAQDLIPDVMKPPPPPKRSGSRIRAELRRWQELHGHEDPFKDTDGLLGDNQDASETANTFTRLGEEIKASGEDEQEQNEAIAAFADSTPEDASVDPRLLRMGDLVELENVLSQDESMLAVFIRRVGLYCQFYTMRGTWSHMRENAVQYSIPGWVSPELVEPLLQHLPGEQDMEDPDTLSMKAYMQDLSVPRHYAAALVSRMVRFHDESRAIYRQHASALDNAHNLLAHDTDLRYGSLSSAATTLLRTSVDKLPLPAMFTVRKALTHAGFAFNIDRRSHRLTGYLQIRSKAQVSMVAQVRDWIRAWQDDLARTSVMSEEQRGKHRSRTEALYVQRFLEKAKRIILKSRETRQPSPCGNVGPSSIKRSIKPDQDSVRITTDLQFTEQDQGLVRFVEAWAASTMFFGLPSLNALPPLLLQATGLYEEYEMRQATGYIFLQELGTLLPYENRVRLDQHLLLPSSQHSKPLQNLMTTLLDMQNKHNLSDSMEDLRHDWKKLPVYCIDAASAHEIDDGISVEKVTPRVIEGAGEEWWVHIHIANPTAFFSREHPLAKMARHMGESIYMPERAFMMLPRWATQRHFSLAPDRPCLTFSARLNGKGEILEKVVRPGMVRNVFRLTPDDVNGLVGKGVEQEQALTVLTVGGDPPPDRRFRSSVGKVAETNVSDLKALQMLAEKRKRIRQAAGGVFYNNEKPQVALWQRWRFQGLAWDHPHRKGARYVEGDPVIQIRAQGSQNWFATREDASDVLVREMMLLSCEIAASWCAERQIPAIFRGTVRNLNLPDVDEFYRTVCAQAVAEHDGVLPMHLGVRFIQCQGHVTMTTQPLKHKMLGLQHYGKVTSPLRRYGDMILHWQIEAALRQEASTGTSLITNASKVDRSFLPFSTPALNAIMTGLRPREGIITRAKSAAEKFWVMMLLFRNFHFGEPTVGGSLPKTLNVYVHTKPYAALNVVGCTMLLLNMHVLMEKPEKHGLGETREGDTWETALERVEVYSRVVRVKPLRLVNRYEGS